MNQLGMVDAETAEAVGQEEYEQAASEMTNLRTTGHPAIVRMARIAGFEPLVPVAEAANTCAARVDNSGTIRWLWFMIVILVLMTIGLVVAGFKVWKMLEKDLSDCWHQAADADDYAWQLKQQIDQLFKRTENLDRQMRRLQMKAAWPWTMSEVFTLQLWNLGVLSGASVD